MGLTSLNIGLSVLSLYCRPTHKIGLFNCIIFTEVRPSCEWWNGSQKWTMTFLTTKAGVATKGVGLYNYTCNKKNFNMNLTPNAVIKFHDYNDTHVIFYRTDRPT